MKQEAVWLCLFFFCYSMPETTWDALFYTDSSLLNLELGQILPENMHLKMVDPGEQADATSHNLLAPLTEDSGTKEVVWDVSFMSRVTLRIGVPFFPYSYSLDAYDANVGARNTLV